MFAVKKFTMCPCGLYKHKYARIKGISKQRYNNGIFISYTYKYVYYIIAIIIIYYKLYIALIKK